MYYSASLDDRETALFKEVDSYTDRASAVIGGAIVESRLKKLLETVLKQDIEIHRQMLRSSGPIGSFSSMINIAYMIGLINIDAHKELTNFKDIRNMFAHKLEIDDFKTPSPRDKSMNLNYFIKFLFTGDDYEINRRYGSINYKIQGPDGTKFGYPDVDERLADPKRRFLLCANFYYVMFSDVYVSNMRWKLPNSII